MSGNRRTHDWTAIRAYYQAAHSARDCRERFGISKGAWHDAVNRGMLRLREAGVAKPRGRTRQAVASLLAQGLSQAAIARELGVSKPTVCFHLRKLNIAPRPEPAQRYDWDVIRDYYEEGHSAATCRRRFGFGRNAWAEAIARGVIRPRPRLEPVDAIFVRGRRRSRHHLKMRLVLAGLKELRCEWCGLTRWRSKPVSLELHHVNGDGFDNRVENLLLLCPNCHSQTDTWGGRNKRGAPRGGVHSLRAPPS